MVKTDLTRPSTKRRKNASDTQADGFWSSTSRNSLAQNTSAQEAWGGALPVTSTLGELLARKLPPALPIIHPWLHSGESCLLWGGTGCGKSMISLTLALAAAGGGEVFGWRFPNPGKVLFVDGEQSERDLQRRLSLLGTAIKGFDGELAAKNLVLMPRAAQTHGDRFVDIAEPGQAKLIADEMGRQGVCLVVFDNLSTLTDSVEEENSAAAFKPMQALLTRLKKLNIAVILVHHAGKDPAKGYRGSSSIATTFERVIGIVRNQSAPVTRIDVKVQLEKFRDEAPDSFQPVFPLKFFVGESNTSGARQAVWEVGQLTQIVESWHMYSGGSFATVAEFVAAYNTRNGTQHSPKNFGRDFKERWITELGKTKADIDGAAERMRELRACRQDSTEEGSGPEF